jgi:hypothetical protein
MPSKVTNTETEANANNIVTSVQTDKANNQLLSDAKKELEKKGEGEGEGEGEDDNIPSPLTKKGGKKSHKKSRKMNHGAKSWVKFVGGVFKMNRAKNPKYTYKQAMKDAAKLKKKNKTMKM